MRKASQFHLNAPLLAAVICSLLVGCVSEIVRKVPPASTDTVAPSDVVVPDQQGEIDATEPDMLAEVAPDGEIGDAQVAETSDGHPVDVVVGPNAEVGPEGGTFVLGGGVTVVVPAGALTKQVSLSVIPAGGQKPEGVTPVTATWEGLPNGQAFKLPITVRLPLIDNNLEAAQWALVKGFVSAGEVFEAVPAWPDLANQEAWVQTTHFSYLLAGLPAPSTTCLSHELCDGKDNDCDGAVDEAADLLKGDLSTGCSTKGVCAQAVDVKCDEGEWSCKFKNPESPPPFYEEGTELSCDAKDNDCDGLVDEDLAGKVDVLESLNVPGIECRTDGICLKSKVLAACWKKSETTAKWVCDYSGVDGFEGDAELSCDSTDNDCDGVVDENTCGLFDPCVEDGACTTGQCALPLGGGENSFCTSTTDGCLAVEDDASLVEVPGGGTWCVDGLPHHRATCVQGAWEEPYLDCAEEEPVNPVCDPTTKLCAGGCNVDEDCQLFEEPCKGIFFCNLNSECEEDVATGPQCHTLNWLCQEFFCEPETGNCLSTSVGEGLSCDDGDACTGNGKCSAGECAGAPEKQCNDENTCTNDFCDPETGKCVYDPTEFVGAPCNDGSICTTNDVCDADGLCSGLMKPCDDGNLCTEDACDEETGNCKSALTPGAVCNDEDPCTLPGTCSEGGQCVLPPVDCNDDNDCTVDTCFLGDCEYTNVPASSSCLHPTSAPGGQDLCVPLGICDGQGVCEPGEDFCECHDDEDCLELDDNLCDGTRSCDIGNEGLFACLDQPGTAVICDFSGDTQCLVNTCDPANGLCSMQALDSDTLCSDDDECTDKDLCADGICVGTVAVDCDDGNSCTNNICDPVAGCMTSPVAEGTGCDDGNPCTLQDQCNADGLCVPGTPKSPACDDGEICTVDTCTPDGSECLYEQIPGCCDSNAQCNEAAGEICTAANVCCAPVCEGDNGEPLECGSDGCGSVCGDCNINAVCANGSCCFPNCYSPVKLCGDDGCGGSCGSCEQQQVCLESFQCCTPYCTNKQCGPDGCGGDCGNCLSGYVCAEQTGKCEYCEANCVGKECGDDGCGGECGQCGEGAECLDGACCVPDCDGRVCGDDGCGGSCGQCLDWQACSPSGQCLCDACCSLHDECGPTELCGEEVKDGEANFIVCYEPLAVFLDGFESHNTGALPTVFKYFFNGGVVPWSVKAGMAPFTTNTGVRSFRYYRVPQDSGTYFSFSRHLPAVGPEEYSMLSFASLCNSDIVTFSLVVKAGAAEVLSVDNSYCDKTWHRHVVDLSALSGHTEFQFSVDKPETGGAEIFIDDLAIFVAECPDDIPCAEAGDVNGVCTVTAIASQSCLIDWACYADGEVSPAVECGWCDSVSIQSNWSPDDSLCDDGNPATNDICDVKDGCFHF